MMALALRSAIAVAGETGMKQRQTPCQKRFDLGFGGKEVLAGAHAVETNEPHDPVHVGSFGVNGVVVQAEYLSDLIESLDLSFCQIRHIRLPKDARDG